MEEFRVDIKVRNNLLLSLIENAGFKSVREFSETSGIPRAKIDEFLNLKSSPLNNDGTFCKAAQLLMDYFGVLPEDIWSPEQMTMELENNKSHINMQSTEVKALLLRSAGHQLEQETPEDAYNLKMIQGQVQEIINNKLTPRMIHVIKRKLEGATEREIGSELNVTGDRIRQIYARALGLIKTDLSDKFRGEFTDNMTREYGNKENEERIALIKAGKHPEIFQSDEEREEERRFHQWHLALNNGRKTVKKDEFDKAMDGGRDWEKHLERYLKL